MVTRKFKFHNSTSSRIDTWHWKAHIFFIDSLFLVCFPRFDYMDKPEVGNTDIIIRSLHEISEGTEVCISYFPINWPLAERQRKLKEEYGFECTCERCQIEEKWSSEDTGDDHDHDHDDDNDHDHNISLNHEDGYYGGWR